MNMNHIDFTATVADVYDRNGNRIDPEIGRGVYREDTGDLLSICGPNFMPVQHSDVVKPVVDFLDGEGYDLQERHNGNRADLYDLRGKKGAWISPKVSDNGAVMRTDIILGDFVEVPGTYDDHGLRMFGKEDINFFKISILNSHNSKLAVRVNTSYLRLVCFNSLTSPHFSASAYGKHTANFSIDGMQAQVREAINMMDKDQDRFSLMAKTACTPEQAEHVLKRTIAKLPNKSNGEAHFSERKLQKILDQFRREAKTVWGLYQAATYVASHDEMKAGSNSLTAMLGREQEVAKMQRSNEWKEMFAI